MPPEPQNSKKPTVTSDAVNGADMSSLFNALAKSMEAQSAQAPARQQLQNDVMFGRHLGTGGAPITPENPTGNAGNPFAQGGLFHGGATAQLSPDALARSQGGTATNQWNGIAAHNTPPTASPFEAAVSASPKPFHLSPDTTSRLGLPPREPTLQDLGRPALPAAQPDGRVFDMFPQANPMQPKPNNPNAPIPPPLGSPQPGFRFSM